MEISVEQSKVVNTEELIKVINSNDNPVLTEFFDIDVRGLERFVKPETQILSLVMLAKARDQGLDIVFVDEEKFFDRSFGRIIGTLRNGLGPFEGAWYIDFELAPVLLHGKTFCLEDYSEPMGFGVTLGAANLTNEIISYYMQSEGKIDYADWQQEEVTSVEQLADYINRMLTVPQPKKKWYTRLPSALEVLGHLALIFIMFGIGLYYILKYLNKGYRYISYLLNKPL